MKFLENLQINLIASQKVEVTTQWDWQNIGPVIDSRNRLYFILEGNAEILFDSSLLALKKGYVYLLPAGRPIQLMTPKVKLDHIYFDFNIKALGGIELFTFIDPPLELHEDAIKKNLPENWKDCISRKKDLDSGPLHLKRQAILQLLLVPFIEEGLRKTEKVESELQRFESVIAYINSHYAEKIKVEYLASKAFLQQNYFSNLFAKQFGMPPQQYICGTRIRNAQKLLENSELAVKVIAEKVGYDDELYFSRLFKRYVGLPPSLYRKRRREIKC